MAGLLEKQEGKCDDIMVVIYMYLCIYSDRKQKVAWSEVSQTIYLLTKQFVLICHPPVSHGEQW